MASDASPPMDVYSGPRLVESISGFMEAITTLVNLFDNGEETSIPKAEPEPIPILPIQDEAVLEASTPDDIYELDLYEQQQQFESMLLEQDATSLNRFIRNMKRYSTCHFAC
jgi:hypothetical protein